MSRHTSECRSAATLSRRRAMAVLWTGGSCALFLAGAPGSVVAQIVDWSADDAARYAELRGAFPEYDDLADREFAARMEALFRALDKNPDAEVIVAEVSRRLPAYRDVPRARMQREMSALFRKARQHFDRP